MTPDKSALLQSILDNPDDDLPRLIYADWLEENDSPERAEFIRLKIALEAEVGEKRDRMEQRARELWQQCKGDWLAQLGVETGMDWDRVWPRGFPDRLTLDGAEAFHRLAAAAFDKAPIRRLSIGGLRTESAVSIVFSPLVQKLVELDFLYSAIGNIGVQFLLASPHVRQLQQLNLSSNGLSDHAVMALAEKDSLPALEVLVLSHNHITDAGAQALARARGLRKLDRLYVNDNRLSETGFRVLRERFRRVMM